MTESVKANPLDIVREYFPDATDEEADGILWERTGWPCFWRGEPEASMRQQLATFKAAVERWPNTPLCENCCNAPSVGFLCLWCKYTYNLAANGIHYQRLLTA